MRPQRVAAENVGQGEENLLLLAASMRPQRVAAENLLVSGSAGRVIPKLP